MGCFGSRIAFFRSCTLSRNGSSSRQTSRRQNTFAVQNVDDTGQGVSPGKLEVTETDLVLHVKGKPSLTWPLRCLRRYGYDNDLFSFESGRRCPTGAGIFAFRCHRAQSLFNLLQARIQGNPSSLPTLPSTPITPPNPNPASNNPTAASTPASSTFVYVNLSESNSSRLLASSGAPVVSSQAPKPTALSGQPPDVVQTPAASKSNEPSLVGQRGPALLISSKPSSVSENHPVYMNVESHGGALYAASSSSKISNNISHIPPPTAPRKNISASTVKNDLPLGSSARGGKSSDCAVYSNVFCSHNRGTTSSSVYGGAGGSTTCSGAIGGIGVVTLPKQDPAEINYAELDLKTDRPSSSSSTNSPHSGRLGFTKLSTSSAEPSDTTSRFSGSTSSGSANPAAKRDFGHPRLTHSQQQNNGDLGYATIDFDKTAQLSVITRSKITLGFESETTSTKKSRHGSTGL